MNHAKKKRGVPDAMSGTPLLSVVFYVVNKNPQNRIRSKSCRNQKKTPEIRGFQVLFWSCWADSNRRPHPYQAEYRDPRMCCGAVDTWRKSNFDPQAMNPIIRKVGEGCINRRKGIGRRIFQ